MRSLTVSMLEGLDYHVLEASDGGDALRILHAQPDIELMFTDLGLRGCNGRQLAEEAQRERPELKVLFTTGYAHSGIVHDGRLDPNLNLILKPFNTASLANKLRAVLDG